MSKKNRTTLYSGGNKANDAAETGTAAFQASDELMAREAVGDKRTGGVVRYLRGPRKGQKKFVQAKDAGLRTQKAKGVGWVARRKGKATMVFAKYRITLRDGTELIRYKRRKLKLLKYSDIASLNNQFAREAIADTTSAQGDSEFSIETIEIQAAPVPRKKKKKPTATGKKKNAKGKPKRRKKAKGKKQKATKAAKATRKANRAPKRKRLGKGKS
jgi:hypothetical protein